MAKPSEELADIQRRFAGYIRDPQSVPPPGDVHPERMAVYRELFVNNMESLLGSGFPVLKAVLPEADWKALVHGFYAEHRSETPLFAEISQEFLDYLGEERASQPSDPPFLLELAHYEWVELALAVAETDSAIVVEPLDPRRPTLDQPVHLAATAWPLAYRFPVHRIGPAFKPVEPPSELTFLLAYRDDEETVRFSEINAVTYRLLEIIRDSGPVSFSACLRRIIDEMAHPAPPKLLDYASGLLGDLLGRGVLLAG